MVHLMNTAMMPREGGYNLVRINKDEFRLRVIDAHNHNQLKSHVGYVETAKLIEDLTGVRIDISREKTIVEEGDSMLICKLEKRLENPADKGKLNPTLDDFEFFYCAFNVKDRYEIGFEMGREAGIRIST